MPASSTQSAPATAKKPASRFPKEITFHRVVFTGRTDPNETPYVPLSVNGLELRIQREQEVILPSNFIEAADHASYDNLVASPNPRQPVIKDGIIRRYPYRIVRDDRPEPTEEDFFNMLNTGNEVTNAVIERNRTAQTS